MSEEEKTAVEKAMEKDCIILFTTNEILATTKDILRVARPGWFSGILEGSEYLPMEIDTKCRGPACAQYNIFNNTCGLT